MKILDLYIARYFFRFFFIVLAIPGILFSFFELLSQLESVGKGTYSVEDALMFVLLTLPGRLQDLLPMTVLLGGIISLGVLSDRNELLAMQASGISIQRISAPVMVSCVVIMSFSLIAGETVIPGLEQEARNLRFQALAGNAVKPVRHGFWARFHDSFIHVEKVGDRGIVSGVDIFEYDRTDRLRKVVHASSAKIFKDRWILGDVIVKHMEGDRIRTEAMYSLVLNGFLNPEQVSALELPPTALSTMELIQYITALEKSGQSARHYTLALWKKFSLPFTTAAMALLSLTFVFGPVREMGAGLRITAGSFVGIALYLGQQLITNIGTFLDLPSSVVAFTPTVVVAAIATVRLRRLV